MKKRKILDVKRFMLLVVGKYTAATNNHIVFCLHRVERRGAYGGPTASAWIRPGKKLPEFKAPITRRGTGIK